MFHRDIERQNFDESSWDTDPMLVRSECCDTRELLQDDGTGLVKVLSSQAHRGPPRVLEVPIQRRCINRLAAFHTG